VLILNKTCAMMVRVPIGGQVKEKVGREERLEEQAQNRARYERGGYIYGGLISTYL